MEFTIPNAVYMGDLYPGMTRETLYGQTVPVRQPIPQVSPVQELATGNIWLGIIILAGVMVLFSLF